MRSRDVRENFSGVAKLCFRGAQNVARTQLSARAAFNHYNTRRLAFHALEAWVLVVCASRLRRAKTSVANAFRSRVAIQRHVKAWIAFVAVKKRDGTRFETRWRLFAQTRPAPGARRGCARACVAASSGGSGRCKKSRTTRRGARRRFGASSRAAPGDGCGSREERRARASRLFDATPIFFSSAATDPTRETCGDPTEGTVESRRTTSAPAKIAMDVPVFPSSPSSRSASAAVARTGDFEGKDSDGNQSEVCRVSRRRWRRVGGGPRVGWTPAAAARLPPPRLFLRSSLRPRLSVDRQNGRPFPSARRGRCAARRAGADAGTRAVITGAGAFHGTPNADALSPARLDAHERCICEFEALKAESARIRDALKEVDASLASNAITECVASVRTASLTTAAQATRRRGAALLPAVRARRRRWESTAATWRRAWPADGDAKNLR